MIAPNTCCAGHAIAKGATRPQSRETVFSLLKLASASAWIPRVKRPARLVLDSQLRSTLQRIESKARNPVTGELALWAQRMYTALRPVTYAMVHNGATIAERELDNLMRRPLKKGIRISREDFDVAMQHVSIERWLKSVSTGTTKTNAKRIARLVEDALEEGLSVGEMAAQLLKTGLALTDSAAERIAHTDSMWAHNEGAVAAYTRAGVTQMEWLTTRDDTVCPFCRDMDGEIIDIGDNFVDTGEEIEAEGQTWTARSAVTHPPLHPNCACTLVPVLPRG